MHIMVGQALTLLTLLLLLILLLLSAPVPGAPGSAASATGTACVASAATCPALLPSTPTLESRAPPCGERRHKLKRQTAHLPVHVLRVMLWIRLAQARQARAGAPAWSGCCRFVSCIHRYTCTGQIADGNRSEALLQLIGLKSHQPRQLHHRCCMQQRR